MAGKLERWEDRCIVALIGIVLAVVLGEEVLGWFMQKPIGGIITLGLMGTLGYVYFVTLPSDFERE